MATATQIKALLSSHSTGDDERFRAVALQVAAAEARKGHDQLAKELRELVRQSQIKNNEVHLKKNVLSFSTPAGEAGDLLELVTPSVKVADLVLDPTLQDRIDRILKEQQNLSRLKERGLR